MSSRRICLWALPILLPVLVSTASAGENYIWLESEQPTRANIELKTDEWAGDGRLSGQKWLKISRTTEEIAQKWPKDGGLLEYDFRSAQTGPYEVWNRIGLEGTARRLMAHRPGSMADDHAGHAHLRSGRDGPLVRSGVDQAGRR